MDAKKYLTYAVLITLFALLFNACGAPTVDPGDATVAPAGVDAATISGRVYAQAPPTVPMAVYAVDAANAVWVSVETPHSEGEASYSLEVQPGNYQLFACPLDGSVCNLAYSEDGMTMSTLSVSAGQTYADISIRPPSQTECGFTFEVPASPDGKFTGAPGPAADCLANVNALQPLADEECTALADAMAKVLGRTGETSPALLQDFVNSRNGEGCQTVIKGTGLDFPDFSAVTESLSELLLARGWQEDPGLSAGGPSSVLFGFRKENKLCQALAIWEPSGEVDCPEDQPISACEVPPEFQLYTITLNCAQSSDADSAVGYDLPRVTPPEFELYLQALVDNGVPLMLPPEFVVQAGQPAIYPYILSLDTGEYEFSLDYGEECQGAGACHYGSMSGKQVTSSEPVGTQSFPFDMQQARQVALANGITGYFTESVCGASCNDATLYWIHNGYQYMVGIKGAPEADMVALANATISNVDM